MYIKNRNSYYITKVVRLKINLTLVQKMTRNISATEAVDFVCDDIFDDESVREGVRELYSYCEVILSRIESWTCSLRLSFHGWLRILLVFQHDSY